MLLIKKLPREFINGYWHSIGLFWCDFCKQEIKKKLSAGKSQKSCGCQRNPFGINNPNYRHGECDERIYDVWKGIKHRCLNLKAINYKDYGGRGITICNEWLEFIPFRDWALGNGYKENLVIDRKDNDKGYCPENCHFVTVAENNRNRKRKI